jgi:integrase/recombinase XerC
MTKGKLQDYVTYLEIEQNASPYTVRNYMSDLNGFFEFLREEGVMSLSMVDHHTVRDYLARLQAQCFARGSIARKLSAIRSLYRYLIREGLISSNPLASTSSPKLEKRLPSFLSIEEVEKLLAAPDVSTPQGQRDRAILELLYASGLRVSEIAGLNLSQVNLPVREVLVLGKGSKERVVLMGEPAARALKVYLEDGRHKLLARRKTNALFLNRYGNKISERRIQFMVSGYAKEAGLKVHVHPHMLRHTFATHLLDKGADLRVVQELLGHASLSSTQIYTHVTHTQARKVYLAAHPGAKEEQ